MLVTNGRIEAQIPLADPARARCLHVLLLPAHPAGRGSADDPEGAVGGLRRPVRRPRRRMGERAQSPHRLCCKPSPMWTRPVRTVLPLPTRVRSSRPISLLTRAACESAKRAIQSSMGMFNASVGKHDSSVKSGKQQEKLERESSQGNFHFIDNYHRFIQQVGVVVDDLLKPILDTPGREVGMREPDDTLKMIKLNDPITSSRRFRERAGPLRHAKGQPRCERVHGAELRIAARRIQQTS
jgi:hypothetical protein